MQAFAGEIGHKEITLKT